MKRYHQRLIYVATVFFSLALLNAAQYFMGGGEDFRKVNGRVSHLSFESYFGRTKYTRRTYYTRSSFQLDNGGLSFYTTESTNNDSLLLQLKEGDEVELYTKRWYHYISYFGLDGNIFLVRKNGELIYDVRYRSRGMNKIFMIITGVMALLLTVIWLDVVKNISLENWFQRKVLLNPEYIKRHRSRQGNG